MTHPPLLTVVSAAVSLALLGLPAALGQSDTAAGSAQPQPENAPVDKFKDDPAAVLGFTMDSIEGEPVPLETYAGKVVLMVNVASRCGLTKQYEGLQALFEEYEERGLVVLGFPANNFGGQEPGTDEEILEFCTGTFDVSFPMFSKISVIGEDRHPLYAKLAKATEEQGGEPNWNFTKYLVDRSGHVAVRFDPRTAPDDPKLRAELERLLEEPAPAASTTTSD